MTKLIYKKGKNILRKTPLFIPAKKIFRLIHRTVLMLHNAVFPTAIILLYHRVESAKNDPHQLCVSPKNFYEQIRFLKENFRVVPLVQLAKEVCSKKLKNKTVAITFDDGYADNLYNALPILLEHNIPATIFITAGHIGSDKPFYWDEKTFPEDRGRPMTTNEAKTLSTARLIEIGGHTISHPKLAKLLENEQSQEISRGKQIIEETLNIPLISFAYPFGGKDSFDKTTIELVKNAGFQYACTNIHERVKNSSNTYALPRYVARNWNLEEFKKEMKKWV